MSAAICTEAREQRSALKKAEEAREKLGISDKKVEVNVPWYDNRLAGACLHVDLLVPAKKVLELDEHTLKVMHFINNVRWRHTRDINAHGVSYIELVYA